MNERSTTEVTAQGITITRDFDAPRELVFRAWTEPARFAQWFGGSEATVPLDTATMDLRPGGAWSVIMLHGEHPLPFSGEFREVAPPERLVMTVDTPDSPADATDELVTVVLEDLGGGKTRMVFTQTGGNLPEDEYGRAAEGWSGFFDSLDEHLAS